MGQVTLHAADNSVRTVPGRRPAMRLCSLRRQPRNEVVNKRADGAGITKVCVVSTSCIVLKRENLQRMTEPVF